MNGKFRNYFVDGNTARGFWSFYKSNLEGPDKLFILNGGSRSVKSNVLTKIGNDWVEEGFEIELMYSAANGNTIAGMVIPHLKIGIVDGDLHNVNKSDETGVLKKSIDLNVAFDLSKVEPYKEECDKLEKNKHQMLEVAHQEFHRALEIHDEWEKIYIDNMNFQRASEITKELAEIFFGDKFLPKKGTIKDRFMGGATYEGAVDFIVNLTEDIGKRYFIKGRPGTGKSTLLKKLAENAILKGFEVEVYHCGFDPNSLDMLIFRELDLAIFDSTAPHEYFPVRDNDEIIDMYKEAVVQNTDEKYEAELQDIVKRYKSKIDEGTSFLRKAKILSDKSEKFYLDATDFEKVEKITNELNSELLTFLRSN